MLNIFTLLFTSGSFEPHGEHFLGSFDTLMWLLVIGNGIIALLYFIMPFFLLYIYFKRPDFPFRYIFFAIPLFGFACSATHIVMIISFWYPLYYLQGAVDFLCGIVSFATFVTLVPACYKALFLESPDVLRKKHDELLEKINLHRKDKIILAQKNQELRHTNDLIQRKNLELTRLNKKLIDQELEMVKIKKRLNFLHS